MKKEQMINIFINLISIVYLGVSLINNSIIDIKSIGSILFCLYTFLPVIYYILRSYIVKYNHLSAYLTVCVFQISLYPFHPAHDAFIGFIYGIFPISILISAGIVLSIQKSLKK